MRRRSSNGTTEAILQLQRRIRQGLISLPSYAGFKLAKTYANQEEECGFSLQCLSASISLPQTSLLVSEDIEFAYDILWLLVIYKRNCALRDAEIVGTELHQSFVAEAKSTAEADVGRQAEIDRLARLTGMASVLSSGAPPSESPGVSVWTRSLHQWLQWRRLRCVVRESNILTDEGLWTIPRTVAKLKENLDLVEKRLRIEASTSSTFRHDAVQVVQSKPRQTVGRPFHLDWTGDAPNLSGDQLKADEKDLNNFFRKSCELLCSLDTLEVHGEKGYLLKQFWRYTSHEWMIGLLNSLLTREAPDAVAETLGEAFAGNLLSIIDDPDDDWAEDLDAVSPTIALSNKVSQCLARGRQVARLAAEADRWEEAMFWGLLSGDFESGSCNAKDWEDLCLAATSSLLKSWNKPSPQSHSLIDMSPTHLTTAIHAVSNLFKSLHRGSVEIDDVCLMALKSMIDRLADDKERWRATVVWKLGAALLDSSDQSKLKGLLTTLGQAPTPATSAMMREPCRPQLALLTQLARLEVAVMLLLCEYDASVLDAMGDTDMSEATDVLSSAERASILSQYLKIYGQYRLTYETDTSRKLQGGAESLSLLAYAMDSTSQSAELLADLIEIELRVVAHPSSIVTLSMLAEPYPLDSSLSRLLETLSQYSRPCLAIILELCVHKAVAQTSKYIMTLDTLAAGTPDTPHDLSHEDLLSHYQLQIFLAQLIIRVCEQKSDLTTFEIPDEDVTTLVRRADVVQNETTVLRSVEAAEWHSEQARLTMWNKAASLVSLLCLSSAVLENAYFECLREQPMNRKRPSRRVFETSPFKGHAVWGTSARVSRGNEHSVTSDIIAADMSSNSVEEMAILWDQPLVEANADAVVRPVWIPLQNASVSLKVGIKTSHFVERFVFQSLVLPFLDLWSHVSQRSVQTMVVGRKGRVSPVPTFPHVDFDILRHQELKLADPWKSKDPTGDDQDRSLPRILEYLDKHPQDTFWTVEDLFDNRVKVAMISVLPLRQFEAIITGQLLTSVIMRCGVLLCDKGQSRGEAAAPWAAPIEAWFNKHVKPRVMCQLWPELDTFERAAIVNVSKDQTPVAFAHDLEIQRVTAIFQEECLTKEPLRKETQPYCAYLRRRHVELQRQTVTVLFSKFVRILSASAEDAGPLQLCRRLAEGCDDLFSSISTQV
eukprot:Blabericola_migrator_1__9914@NODE_547_length_7703_cov_86_120351_g413_i0_p1_GENE_NODE_547_length_7703_cov_86_120351_g413_i0NODE_547_length_7703_cov_86_120351_g413_i0_p1_ORF_typecomplete_len1169_score191_39_NODE_547_length_7703_cov_86_120351_g413_i041177623